MHRSKKESATSPLKYLLRTVEIFTRLVQLNQLCFAAEDLLVLTHTKRSHDKEWETVHSRALLQNPPQPAWRLSAGLHPSSIPAPSASLGQLQQLWLLDQSEKSIWIFPVTFTPPAYYGALCKPKVVGWNIKVWTRSEVQVFISQDKWLLKASIEGCCKTATYKIQISRSKSCLKFSHTLLKLVE